MNKKLTDNPHKSNCYLIKSEEYFNQLRIEKKDSVLYIPNSEKNNLTLYELESLFRNNLYKYYFFEHTPYLDFFADYKLKEAVEIYILIENSCYIPLILRMKSVIIMEKSDGKKTELTLLRKKVVEMLEQNKSNPLFKSIVKDIQFVFFSRDMKVAGDLFAMLIEKYGGAPYQEES